MDKLKMHSINKVDENIGKIGKLFPNCITERKNEKGEVEYAVDFDMLKQELSSVVVEGNEERYQFTWPDKKKSILLANAPIAKTLRPCREESVDFDNTENLYIEGDNLDVLKLLQETYLGKIKMIYIDPPYNTGNDTFVYDDDFSMSAENFAQVNGNTDENGNIIYDIRTNNDANGRFHTDWLNMMYPRLKICKSLLKDDGVIFISIDNNEISNVKKLCDEIFGETSFVTILHVQMSTVQGQKVRAAKAGNIVKNGEHILVYSKDGNKAIGRRPLLDPVKYDNHYCKFIREISTDCYEELSLTDIVKAKKNIVNELTLLGLIAKESDLSQTKIQEYYEHSPLFKEFVKENAHNIVRAHDSVDVPDAFKSKMQCDLVYKYSSDNRTYLVAKNSSNAVSQRIQLSEKLASADDFYNTYGPTTIRGDWWSGFYLDMGNVSKEGGVNYDNGKKPIRLIKQLIDFCTEDNDIILDFFGGSGTTAHAALELAASESSNRKFIIVQIDEDLDKSLETASAEAKKSIKQSIKFLDEIGRPHKLSEIGKERIRRAGTKIKEESPMTTVDLDTGFRVLKLDSTNMKDVYYNPADYELNLFDTLADNIKEDRTPEDLLFQVMLDLGVLLSSKIEESTIGGKKVFNVADGFLYACFDENVTEDVITEIAKQNPYYFVMRDSSMANDSVATNFEQIFATYSPDTVRKVL